MKITTVFGAWLIVLASGLAGCGGGDDTSGVNSANATPSGVAQSSVSSKSSLSSSSSAASSSTSSSSAMSSSSAQNSSQSSSQSSSSSSSKSSSSAGSTSSTAGPPSAVAIATAYQGNCARCHGTSGEGLLGYPALNGVLVNPDIYSSVSRMPSDGTTLDCGTAIPDAAVCRKAIADYITANLLGKANATVVMKDPLRRLSKEEYSNAVADLLPGATLPVLDFPAEMVLFSFYNNYSAQAPSDLLISSLYKNATATVDAISDATLSSLIVCTSRDTLCANTFIETFGRRAYRRPLQISEVDGVRNAFYVNATTDATFKTATRLVLKYFLMSADFLYRPEFGSSGNLNPYEKAARLSFFIWQSIPDDTLLDAAKNGGLDTTASFNTQVDRLLNDAKAERGVRQFFGSWMNVDKIDSLVKDPQYSISDMQKRSLKESILKYSWLELYKKNLPITQLLTTNTFYVDSNIAPLFGVTSNSAQLQAQTFVANQRFGVLTHPGILASYAHRNYPSPVLRGVFVMDRIFCSPPNPPPPGASSNPPQATGTPQTNRDLYQAATVGKGSLCASCHNVINPLGFSMEMFETDGTFRSSDNGLAIDAKGVSFGLSFNDVFDLSNQISTGNRFAQCSVRKALAFATGGWNMVDDLTMRGELTMSSNSLRTYDLFKAVATHPNFAQKLYPAQ